ncbi:MAG: flavodoxin-dependent (E)-4-hydroxy-3-methylbut-2-enyl-diphosphate synthase [Clostridia bacterium]|nr:flavodoxin-dependent (E)-4-hydroxy-3-methylbut-2-enyl-diphosphate synthase [Clostridia bacterium]MBQ2940126.1 flavodoxin-dependent (E)-4-hydroxy-3-methylbut-2-enyl-diphosphate synthase [Clostridia bacterium]
MQRRNSKTVWVGRVPVGGDSPITVQSMLNVPASDIEGNVRQALALQDAGVDILRTAVPDKEAVRLVAALKEAVTVPIVADIHFDYRLALECVAAGVDKIRINPGNIGGEDRVKAVADACREKQVPIRIGVNSGSLEKQFLEKYGHPTAEAMRDSALYHASLLEKFDFTDIVLSIKSSDVQTMRRAYQLTAEACDYPLHLGVTEAGTPRMGLLKSAAGIGSLLLDGIGDTIRISLTASPVEEVKAGIDLLRSIGLRRGGANLVACPTCGRTAIDLIGIASEVEERLRGVQQDITVAVMGCIVNGPGEAKEADIGLAGGNGKAVIFRKGETLRTVDERDAVDALMEEIEKLGK